MKKSIFTIIIVLVVILVSIFLCRQLCSVTINSESSNKAKSKLLINLSECRILLLGFFINIVAYITDFSVNEKNNRLFGLDVNNEEQIIEYQL